MFPLSLPRKTDNARHYWTTIAYDGRAPVGATDNQSDRPVRASHEKWIRGKFRRGIMEPGLTCVAKHDT